MALLEAILRGMLGRTPEGISEGISERITKGFFWTNFIKKLWRISEETPGEILDEIPKTKGIFEGTSEENPGRNPGISLRKKSF